MRKRDMLLLRSCAQNGEEACLCVDTVDARKVAYISRTQMQGRTEMVGVVAGRPKLEI